MSSIVSLEWLLGWEGFCVLLYVVLAAIAAIAYGRYKEMNKEGSEVKEE
ncbi:MAG: hypothetical protein QXW94_07335 [Desulfurococcaceae archaeon]